MNSRLVPSGILRVGDADGSSQVYDSAGDLLEGPSESILRMERGWDMSARSPWRRLLPKVIFQGFDRNASSRLYVTTERVVLIRDIDPWREVAGEMSPLGMPNALAKREELGRLAAKGIRQFCEVHPDSATVVHVRRSRKGRSWIRLDLMGNDGRKYSISYWKTDDEESEMLSLIESRFHSDNAR